ncbi:glycosyltransferase [Aerococcaceae bacterium 50-4]
MNIGFLITNLSGGGAARTVTALANSISKLGHNVIIIQIDGAESVYNISDTLNVIKLNEQSENNTIDRLVNQYKRIKKIRNICKKNKLEIIVAMNVSMIYFALIATSLLKTNVIGAERSNPYLSLNGSVKQKVKKLLSLFTDGFIFQTKESANFYPILTQRKGIVIQNAVYNEDIINISPSNVRKKRITSVGRLIESKGFDFLIEVFSEFINYYPDYTLDIYGEGEERGNLTKIIKKLKLYEKVQLHGNTSDIASSIKDSGMFVFPSRHEGMPNALIEALALGIPCISTNCSMGPRELIQNGVNGILVEVDNEKELLAQMIKLAADENYAERLGKKAVAIRETNSIEKVTNSHINYFVKVLNS